MKIEQLFPFLFDPEGFVVVLKFVLYFFSVWVTPSLHGALVEVRGQLAAWIIRPVGRCPYLPSHSAGPFIVFQYIAGPIPL